MNWNICTTSSIRTEDSAELLMAQLRKILGIEA